ncbi:uncharacterized protein LOC131344113 isoform X2 [Hemibagrus wyckioides]|uniref:uncharacterized protein LOC131344113 isoform X2 n=1 Tax=Hemibagrus wyckioides TaxID=337641 RepID=UPI00266DD024|nr:uncharacterized protein LOC131344113 isoform X2 [Hemibagrus wyckioides]
MMAWCRFDSYHLIFLLMLASTECRKCSVLNVDAVLNSVVTLTCPLTTWPEATQVIWEVLQGERAERVGNCSSSCTTGAINNRTQKPLCKVRAVEDLEKGTGSLIISPVAITDAVWYRCTVQNRTGPYCSEIKISVKDEPQLQTLIKDCKSIDPFEAVLNKTFMLQCPVDRSHLDASQLIWGTLEADVTIPITRCPTGCTSSGAQKPLCERAKTMKNGSLTISPMWPTDTQWFWCALSGSSTSCYKFKLIVKENGSTTWQIKAKGATQSAQEQTDTVVIMNATMLIITSATSAIFLLAILVGVYIYFQKQKKENTHKVERENPYDDTEAINSDFCQFSFVQVENESLHTCKFVCRSFDL